MQCTDIDEEMQDDNGIDSFVTLLYFFFSILTFVEIDGTVDAVCCKKRNCQTVLDRNNPNYKKEGGMRQLHIMINICKIIMKSLDKWCGYCMQCQSKSFVAERVQPVVCVPGTWYPCSIKK